MNAHPDAVGSARAALQEWSDSVLELIRDVGGRTELERLALERESIFFGPGSPEDIAQLEGRLHTRLPPSYVVFLSATSGLIHLGLGALLLPVSRVDLFRKLHPDEAHIVAQGGEVYPCEPSEVAPRAVAGLLSRETILDSIAVSEVASGQFIAVIRGAVEDGAQPIAFAFDFWDVPRLYSSFLSLLSDEKERSITALRASA